MINIIVGSRSAIKLGAAGDAVLALELRAVVDSTDVPSDVNNQPYGRRETLRGATCRAEGVFRSPGGYAVAVENGVVRENGGHADLAYVVVLGPSGRKTVGCSEAVPVPDDLVELSRASGWTKTCGQLQAEISGCDHANPHVVWGGQDRRAILARAIRAVLAEAVAAEQADIPPVAPVEIAGLVRPLPVRRVAPGLHLGILKLTGDDELTEAAGAALAQKMPLDVEAIVSPDGKAQPLLHVVQRELRRLWGRGVPAVLARKERKSYMVDPVTSTASSSITTREKCHFYLDGDDVSLLHGRKVAIVDDVVSTGSTYDSLGRLLRSEDVGVREIVEMAVATEGDAPRPGVIALANLKIFVS